MAVTAAQSPSSLPQSSAGRFDVSKVLARSCADCSVVVTKATGLHYSTPWCSHHSIDPCPPSPAVYSSWVRVLMLTKW
jgi:hypothetical protein